MSLLSGSFGSGLCVSSCSKMLLEQRTESRGWTNFVEGISAGRRQSSFKRSAACMLRCYRSAVRSTAPRLQAEQGISKRMPRGQQ